MTLKQNILVYAAMLVFIGINCVLFVQGFYWFAALPALLFLFWLVIYHPGKVLYFIAFATPLSLKYTFEGAGLSLNVPTEIFIIPFMLLFWLKLFLDGEYDWRMFKHPISLVILFNLFWIFVTSCTSSMPIVSFKFLLSRFWFVTVFYFFGVWFFRKYGHIKTFIWAFCAALSITIFNALARHASHNFDYSFSSKAVAPFFVDHGVYSAVISLFIPILLLFFLRPRIFRLSAWHRFFAGGLFSLFVVAIIISYTRAAWVGMACAAAAALIFFLRIRFSTLIMVAAAALVVASFYQTEIYFKLKSNKKVSTTDFEQHVTSMYNISTDVSNTERINRWSSALRMFEERPVVGWGPGTYMFQYAPFQLSNEMTIISTRAGIMGNAHSEYIGPLAESGFLGTLSFIAIFLVCLYKAMKLMYKSQDRRVRYTALGIMLGLITYFAHGLVNNYLDSDKASVPFWALIAMLTALDMYYKEGEENKKLIQEHKAEE